jgi:hypothetical protein
MRGGQCHIVCELQQRHCMVMERPFGLYFYVAKPNGVTGRYGHLFIGSKRNRLRVQSNYGLHNYDNSQSIAVIYRSY